VWVQDYQLQLVPKMLRMLRPDLTIGFFLHIPFPPVELFMQMPWRTEITEGLLGADLVGFHLAGGAQNFLVLARRLIGANTPGHHRGAVAVRQHPGWLPHREGGRLPDLDRLGRPRPEGPQPRYPAPGPRDPRRAG
jgi:trehalose 6-phosphate synthase